MLVSTGCEDCSEATIPLRATIQDITAVDPASDPDAGDITNASVTFVDRGSANAVLCTADVNLFDPADSTTGTANCDWQADIGNSDGNDYTVGIAINGYYTRDSSEDDTIVVVSKPGSDFVTGGGFLINQSSAGVYAGDPDAKTNFGLNVKLNPSGRKIQGRVTIIVRQGDRVYQIRSNALSSLVVVAYNESNQASGTAEFFGKANVQDVTDQANPISLEGNATLHITMKDNGEPGISSDAIAISLWRKSGALLFSSTWNGLETIKQELGGGNLQIH